MSRLNLEVDGRGPTVALLHGWALNLRVWDGLRQALGGRFRLIAIDLPGHGRSAWLPERGSIESQAEQVRAALAPLAARCGLVGWSLGGQIALRLAATAPTRREERLGADDAPASGFERLVLIATSPRLSFAPDWPYGAPPARLDAQAAESTSDYRHMVSDFLELQVRGSAASAAVLDAMRRALFAHGEAQPAALARGLELLRDTDLRPLLPRVTVPALVVAGQYDRITPPGAARALAEALPRGRYVEIRRAGHAPFLSHGAEVAALLGQFLAHA